MGLSQIARLIGLMTPIFKSLPISSFDASRVIWVHTIAPLLDGLGIHCQVDLVFVELGIQTLHNLMGPCKYIFVFV